MEVAIHRHWKLDAQNGYLSYSKMKYNSNMRHARTKTTVTKNGYEKVVSRRYSLCTATGWFLPCTTLNKSDLSEELGLGLSLYFKTIKQLIIFFILCTILSIPSFVFFSTGQDEITKDWLDSKTLFSTLTLGNLGQSSTGCGQTNFISLVNQTTTLTNITSTNTTATGL